MKLKSIYHHHYFPLASDNYRSRQFNAPFITINQSNAYLLPLIIITLFIIAGYNF